MKKLPDDIAAVRRQLQELVSHREEHLRDEKKPMKLHSACRFAEKDLTDKAGFDGFCR